MPTLHLLNKTTQLSNCLMFLSADDVLVLSGAAVQLVLTPDQLTNLNYYVLSEDLSARGLSALVSEESQISMEDFVKLICSFDRQVAW